jgi:hypothetical protein
METKSPRAGESARAGKSIAADASSPTRNRPILQASEAARERLALLTWPLRLKQEKDDG